MSYEAFEAVRLVEKLPLKICALATWEDSFILSTYSAKNETRLLVYNIRESTDYDRMYEAKLVKLLKKFTAKPITQLAVVPEYNIFLGLSDNEVFYADLEHFAILGHLQKSKGATYFAVDWQKLRGRIGYSKELRVCVSTRKKLQLYEWKRGHIFVPMKSDLNFPDTPRAFAWVGDSLIICIKKDLYHVRMDGNSKELFPIGSYRSDPCLLPLMSGDILVLKDEMQISLDSSAKPTQSQPLVWSELPSCIEHVHPFIIGVLPRNIEVRALEQKIQVQTIKLEDKIQYISTAKNTLIASQTQVYKLEPKAYDQQVSQLVQGRQFELALVIAQFINEPAAQKTQRRHEILRRFAFQQFTQHKFHNSLQNYLEIKEDLVNVIGLYPNLLPQDLRQHLSQLHPTKLPTLSGQDLEEGMKHLTKYLTQMRYRETQKLLKQRDAESEKTEKSLDESGVKNLKERLQLIDTTLLKCYIKTRNRMLIESLVRLPENYLHIQESERVLKQEDKFKELIDLYYTKKLHNKALQLLSQFAQGPSGQLLGVWPTIEYLNRLTADYIHLVLEYSVWAIKAEPHDAIRIFTEDLHKVKAYPRQVVIDHLNKHVPELTIQYLEHIIDKWEDTTETFHNRLIQLYQTRVVGLLASYKEKNKGQPRAWAGEEPGELGVLRTKLLRFLTTSKHYVAAQHITSFLQDDLFEERALLLSRLEKHEVSMAIYVYVLKEPKPAEEVIVDAEEEESREVCRPFIKMYHSTPNLSDYGIRLPDRTQPEASVEDALSVLAVHQGLVDTAKMTVSKARVDELERSLSEQAAVISGLKQNVLHYQQENQTQLVIIQQLQEENQAQSSINQQLQEDNQTQMAINQQLQQNELHCQEESQTQLVVNQQLQVTLGRAQRIQQGLDFKLKQTQAQLPPRRQTFPQMDERALETQALRLRSPMRFDQPIGEGSYGAVYAVEHDGKPCIAKRLHDILVGRKIEFQISEQEKNGIHQKFVQECVLLSQTQHPNIVRFIGVINGRDKYDLTLLMERLSTDLHVYLLNSGNILLSLKVSILHDVSCGLLYLHEHSIIHRDLSASNILLTASTPIQAKIADLGMSRFIDHDLFQLTNAPGAQAYMSPEALQNRKYDESLDIFSFGVISLFAAMQEFPQFSYVRVPDAVHANGEGEIYKRSAWIDKMNTKQPELSSLVLWCLQDDPMKRPSTFCLNILLGEMKKDPTIE